MYTGFDVRNLLIYFSSKKGKQYPSLFDKNDWTDLPLEEL